jgi:hypothetical protein
MPKTIPEQIEAAALLMEHLSNAIVNVTCTKFAQKKCIEPGKPLMPEKAVELHKLVEQADSTLQATKMIPIDGSGDCLGAYKSQAQCLAVVSNLLTQVDAYLISQGKK